MGPMVHAVEIKLHYVMANLVAVLLHHLTTFHGAGTAVAAIVLTPFVVVLIVAVAVSKVLGKSTTFMGVDALALQRTIALISV